jgi:hypothetical protein
MLHDGDMSRMPPRSGAYDTIGEIYRIKFYELLFVTIVMFPHETSLVRSLRGLHINGCLTAENLPG